MPFHITKPQLLFLLLCLLTVAVYYPGLSGDYLFDDMTNLLKNNRLNMESLDVASLQSASLSSDSGMLRRPVSMLSFALNRYFFGIDPYSYKVINLGIHLLTGIGLFWLARLIMLGYRQFHRPGLTPAAVTWLPVVVSGIWLVHPLNLTGVLYIVQRMTSLSALFLVCGLCLFAAGRMRMRSGRRGGLLLILAGLIGFGGLAVFSKENGALLPLYMLVLELSLFRFRDKAGRLDKTVTSLFVLIVLIPGLLALAWLISHPGFITNGYNRRDFTLVERLMTEARILVFYLKMIVMPSISELGLYHDDIAISKGLFDPPATIQSLLFLAALLAAGFAFLKKLPLVSLGIFWFFAGHVLESSVIPLELAHEHRNYLPDFGIILAAGALLLHLPASRIACHIRTVAPAVFILLLAGTTWVRAGQWSDNVNFAVYESRHHPVSPRAAYTAGRIYARLAIRGHAESTKNAFRYLQQSSELDHSGILADVVMIKLASILGVEVKQAWYDAIVDKLALTVNAADVTALATLALCQEHICATPYPTMEKIFRIALNNDSLKSRKLRSHVYCSYGYYQIKILGDLVQGRDYFERAAETNPAAITNWLNLLKLLVQLKDYDAAEDWLARFHSAGVPGASESDYDRFRRAIDKGRLGDIARAESAGNGTEN